MSLNIKNTKLGHRPKVKTFCIYLTSKSHFISTVQLSFMTHNENTHENDQTDNEKNNGATIFIQRVIIH